MPSILIVCTANICRSPMAEAMLKQLLAERPDADRWHIESAGTWATYGHPAAELSQQVMKEMGLDISNHQSKPVTEELLYRFDLILTMEENQKEALTIKFKLYADRIFLISEMVGILQSIPDPIGGTLADYQDTARLIQKILVSGLDKIIQLANKHSLCK
jgi:protein-tyrosine phosphatase